jgi:aryl-alcohol dehydrogenase-like predicted oxidoreductase
MKFCRYGNTNVEVSRIAFGTWAFSGGWGQFDHEESKAAIRKAFELGINFFDTAQAYGFGLSERLLGEGLKNEIKAHRQELILATKGGLRLLDDGKLVRDSSAKWLRQGLTDSLKYLGTDYIDLYQVHWPDPNTPFEETAQTMADFVKEGLIRFVGLSNYDVAQMMEFGKTVKINSLQPPYHIFRREIEGDILAYTKKQGIGVMVYGPMAHGLLAGKMTNRQIFAADDWRSKSKIFNGRIFEQNLAVVEELKEFSRNRGVTVSQLAIAWTLANPAVDVAIVGARNPEQIIATAPAVEVSLTNADLIEIDKIIKSGSQVIDPSPEGVW